MMPTMTREQFEDMTLDELLEWAYENIADVTTEDTLCEFAKKKIDDSDFNVAMHILAAIWESEEAYNDYYRYDYTMGTLETPMPITCKEDIEDLIDFVEEEIEVDLTGCINFDEDSCDDPEVDEEYLAYYKKEGED